MIRNRMALVAFAYLLALSAASQTRGDELLDVLLADYRQYGLPLPPKGARLVLHKSPDFPFGEHQTTLFFEVRPATKERPGVYLGGLSTHELRSDAEITPVTPTPDLVSRVETEVPFLAFWTMDLPVAIQCHSLGHQELAGALLQRDRSRTVAHYGKPLDEAYAHRLLVDVAWAYYCSQLVEPDTDRKLIAKRMQALLDTNLDSPRLGRDEMQRLHEDLLKTLEPSQAEPGSVEALIDGLAELSDICIRDDDDWKPDPFDPEYYRLWIMGFRAVPALLRHAEDTRLTRMLAPDMFSGKHGSHITRVGDIACDFLRGLAGDSEYDTWWPRDESGMFTGFDRGKAEAWWKGAQEVGEEAYLLKHLYDPKEEGSRVVWPGTHKLHILAARYPQRLVEEYEKVVKEMPECGTDEMVELLSKSEIDADRIVSAFLAGAQSPNIPQRQVALRELFARDHPKAVPLLVESLKLIPRLSDEQYEFEDLERLTWVVDTTADPRVWKALADAAKGSPLDRRLDVFDLIGGQRQLMKRELAFFATFLSDDEVIPREMLGMRRLWPFDVSSNRESARLAVRDLAAYALAGLLDLPDQPDPSWTEAQWLAFRERVQAALSKQ